MKCEHRIWVALISLMVTGCSPASRLGIASPVAEARGTTTAATAPVATTVAPIETATQRPTRTPRPTATLTPGPDGVCPARSDADLSVRPGSEYASLVELREHILTSLNLGMSPAGIEPLLGDESGDAIGSIREVDLTSDEVPEIVLATSTTIAGDVFRLGWVAVYECSGGQYSENYYDLGE